MLIVCLCVRPMSLCKCCSSVSGYRRLSTFKNYYDRGRLGVVREAGMLEITCLLVRNYLLSILGILMSPDIGRNGPGGVETPPD